MQRTPLMLWMEESLMVVSWVFNMLATIDLIAITVVVEVGVVTEGVEAVAVDPDQDPVEVGEEVDPRTGLEAVIVIALGIVTAPELRGIALGIARNLDLGLLILIPAEDVIPGDLIDQTTRHQGDENFLIAFNSFMHWDNLGTLIYCNLITL